MEVETLKKKIRQLSGVQPVSNDAKHLKARLDELRKGTVVSVYMSTSEHAAVCELADRLDMKVSELTRKALAEYARNHDHRSTADMLEAAAAD